MNRHEFQKAAKNFRAGKLTLADFTDQVLPVSGNPSKPDSGDAGNSNLPDLPARPRDGHKGKFGHVVVVAGSANMAGAAALAAMGTLRVGAGLVTVATAASAKSVVAQFSPVLMTLALTEDEDGLIKIPSWESLRHVIPKPTAMLIGPGLGQSASLRSLCRDVWEHADCPCLFDADGLNNLGHDFAWPGKKQPARVMTPHPGELQRLVGRTVADRAEQETLATDLALRAGATVVLKGHRTLVVGDGQNRHNATGNAGMATAGAGDVLSGVIAGLLSQGMTGWAAAALGVHLHGAAGDAAAKRRGMHALIATDLLDSLPEALVALGSPTATA